jgi:hypothetical protein
VCAAADAKHLNLGASSFLRWKVFEDLAGQGYEGNDLTDAALNPVTHFKSQLGADLEMCLTFKTPDSLAAKTLSRLWNSFSRGEKYLRRHVRTVKRKEKVGRSA